MPRLLIVSNRLPFTITEKSGTLEVQESSGGLVTALGSYLESRKDDKDFECLWVGWPGIHMQGHRQSESMAMICKKNGAHPVWMHSEEMNLFYHGFCNRTLWPLFHYLPSYTHYDEHFWEAYKRVNLLFRDTILSILRPDDTIWIQDYQLLLLPKLLRERAPNHAIGFFLHIPFPSFEIFRLLPSDWRREILEGMLGANFLGFHTHDYTHYFLRSVFRTLGYEHKLGTIYLDGRVVRADTIPLGIDYGRFHKAAKEPAVIEEAETIASKMTGMKIISSVDRLDYTKGILHRLKGFENFLETNPDWAGKVVFILAVVPSREEVEQYKKMKKEIDEAVGKINGAFGTAHWTPVVYQYRSLPFPNLVALYNVSDVALLTPLRDGMNLVSKEYLASKPDGTGVLILSEMAGAASELGESLLVNPNHKGEIAQAIRRALEMPRDEQIMRNLAMQERLRKNDSRRWASEFEKGLDESRALEARLNAKHLSEVPKKLLLDDYRASQSRLILLDYDGTLIPFASYPDLAFPDPKLIQLLAELARDERNHIYIVSGRKRDTLKQWFGRLDIGLIAEHGVWICPKDSDWKLIKPLEVSWKNHLLPILEANVERLNGSFLESKDYSVAWHYRNADPELGAQRAKELIDTLVQFTANLDVQVLEGKKVVEVRCAGINKGTAAAFCQETLRPVFTLAVGDDVTDEDLFRAFPPTAHTIRVGMNASYAGYNLRDYREVRALLTEMAATGRPAYSPPLVNTTNGLSS